MTVGYSVHKSEFLCTLHTLAKKEKNCTFCHGVYLCAVFETPTAVPHFRNNFKPLFSKHRSVMQELHVPKPIGNVSEGTSTAKT